MELGFPAGEIAIVFSWQVSEVLDFIPSRLCRKASCGRRAGFKQELYASKLRFFKMEDHYYESFF